EGAAGLGDLVLVMGEDEIEAAAMDVELAAQIGGTHGRAFDMPARPAANDHRLAAPLERSLPARGVAARFLPQHEIGRIALVRLDPDPRAGLLLVELAPRQGAVAGHGGDIEQDLAPLGSL